MATKNVTKLDTPVEGKAVVTTPSFYGLLAAAASALGVFGGQLGWWELTDFQTVLAQITATVGAAVAFFERVMTNVKVTKFW